MFRKYIIAFARLVDVDLSGDPIITGNNGAELIFLGTNSNTAQSHNGDLYVDEIFWIPNFQKLRKVASGMASQLHLRTTYFSTPSTLAHCAYPFWSGELFNLDQLKQENSADDFRNLFMCEFVDDKASVFPFEELQRCMVDAMEEWEDFEPFADRPFNWRPLWIGYDPSNTVDYIGIDATGIGQGVYQLVRSFFPAARAIHYTPEMKTAMVLKAKDTIRRGCLEYDAGATDITQSFMAIRKTMTSSGRSATYEASRSEEASHADIAGRPCTPC